MLTVVIPTKNEETYLPRLLRSLRAQTFAPAEIIVADAWSTDRTRDVAVEYGARVVDGGMPGPGRNRGAEAATTEYVLFLDADVELLDPMFLERAMGEMIERKLDVAACDVLPLSDSRVDHVMHAAYNHYVRVVRPVLAHAPGFCVFARRTFHKMIGGFDESVTFCEDHEYAQRADRHGVFGLLQQEVPVSVRRMEKDGRVSIAVKFFLAEIHLAAIGPIRHDLFAYKFGHRPKVEA